MVLRESGSRTAYVASWDAHHLAVLGAFANGIASQAYQFRLVDRDDLREPAPGLSCVRPRPRTLPWLESTGFQDDYGQFLDGDALSIAVLDEAEAGIAVHVRHALADDVVDIGMYVDPALRRRGVGSSILALTARDVLSQGRTPVAGCWGRTGPRGSPSRPPA